MHRRASAAERSREATELLLRRSARSRNRKEGKAKRIARSRSTADALERAMQLIKGGFSHRLESKFPIWQRSFEDRRIRDREDFMRHREYIHHNPVRAGLCQLPEDYPFSSAHRKLASVP
jgi:REP element-mobilizing transposase RayT